jgi:rod shape-determining protein MreD
MYRRWLIVFATTLLLWSIVCQINHYLSPFGVFISAGGLLVTFAALRLNLRNGLAATILIGLAVDALEPIPVVGHHVFQGPHLLLFTTAHILIFRVRGRFPREEALFALSTALVANLGISLGLFFIYVVLAPFPVSSSAGSRLLADLAWSQLFIVAAGPWFFSLQQRALELGRIDLSEENHRFY